MKRPLVVLSIFLALSAMADLSPGVRAPDFAAKNQDGKEIRLDTLRGKYVLLYFYPKDDTPGCTKEACSFRDGFARLKREGVVVYGISRQDEKSHQAFRAKYHLPFDLLVDTNGKLADEYGIGSIPIIGLFKRQSVLIGPEGKVLKIYKDVDPGSHSRQVLQDIAAFQGEK